ncbi:MAG: porin [bacterium]
MRRIRLLFVPLLAASLIYLNYLANAAENQEPVKYPTAEVFGFVHFWTQTEYVNDAWDNTTFRLARARLGVKGKIRENVSYCALTEGGDLAITNQVAPTSKGISLVDCYLTYHVHPLLNVRFGQEYHRFAYEGDLILPVLPFIFRAEAIDAVWLTLGRVGSYAYDTGVWFYGESDGSLFPLHATYQLALTNGSGLKLTDDNEAKDVTGRVTFKPLKKANLPIVTNLHLGASFFFGTSTVVTQQASGLKEDLSERAYAVEFVLPQNRWRLMAELIWADYDGSGEVPQWKQSGGYAALGMSPLKSLELLGRYAYYNQNEALDDALLETITFGVTYTFAKLSSVKLNYLLRDAGEDYPTNPGNLLIAQIQFMW